MSHSPRRRTVLGGALLLVPLALGGTGCSSSNPLADAPYDAAGQVVLKDAEDGRKVDPSVPLEVTATGDDRITDVIATDAAGRYVGGELAPDGSSWHSTGSLAAGAHYTVRVSTEDEDGAQGRRTIGFDTGPATRLLTVAFGPKTGTYGVGQPITAELSTPVQTPAARAVVERTLRVESRPAVQGSWYWVNNRVLHYRPKEYWPAHASIDVHATLDGIKVGGGMYGGPSKPLHLDTGDRVEAVTDAAGHYMSVLKNGQEIRSIPVTTGKPGYDTRNGVKVILGQESFVRMRGDTIGIAEGSADSYDLPVYWATRVTWSGEYVHAAPWSVGSQGADNVSHGCTGMSTENAKWFFDTVRVGDIVKVVGSAGATMTPFDNGFGDWNLSWEDWRKGSALAAGTREGATPADAARLRPRV
ncbi:MULTISPECIES: L,D-transpeptidase [Streptomyces]|uniref:L,D-transpeptidase n=1 Tax=Streptomyces TaxID=1883 RepID=UPI00163CC54A|nr:MULTISPECIES: Ig-like domain-containing protein [Streptomyces]MBC2878836.1 L,D-transpeptidase family protein [Streptomyces sp. TYQ1024]UBI39249.1 L,D-transpeptidase family protein [Streptomyces mobaraensis]UKW31830.1 Ig-like domain-containing protein [Streptomyces sp. TYQ1024]